MISVLMAVYREPEAIFRAAIDSILTQSFSDFELIIIVDDPDNDALINLIKEYSISDSRIRIFINDENLGLPKSLNRGLSSARGKYIARMDADDISTHDRLEAQLTYLIKGDYDFIGGLPQVISDNGEPLFGIARVPDNPKHVLRALRYGQCVAHPTWLAKKAVFDALGGYRSIPLCEDYDFTLRAALAGFSISNLNKVVLSYRMTEQSVSRSNLYRQYLYMKFISKEYAHGRVADINKAAEYVRKKWTDEKAISYSTANNLFNHTVRAASNKKPLNAIANCVRLPFISVDYLDKVFRFAMISFCALP